MKNAYPLIASIATALLLAIASPAQAQPGPGMGQGMGQGYGAGQGAGMGQGYGRGFNNTNTRGWSLMTAEERTAHRDKMWSAKSYEECKSIQQNHHQTMLERAREQGKTLPMPHRNPCDRMRANGYYK